MTSLYNAKFKLGRSFYVSSLSKLSLFSVLNWCAFLLSELTVSGMETLSTRVELKEHIILGNLAISDVQIIRHILHISFTLKLNVNFRELKKEGHFHYKNFLRALK